MSNDYDIFEQQPARSVWRGSASSLYDAHRMLAELAESTTNECLAIDLAAGQIVARVNDAKLNKSVEKPRVVGRAGT